MTNKEATTLINLHVSATAEETRMWIFIVLIILVTEFDCPLWLRIITFVATVLQMVVKWLSEKALEMAIECQRLKDDEENETLAHTSDTEANEDA